MSDTNQFVGREALLEGLGVDIKKLGYVGLDFDPLDVQRVLSYGSESGVGIIPAASCSAICCRLSRICCQ